MKTSFSEITKDSLADFSPFLLPQAVSAIGREDTAALGAVSDGKACAAIAGTIKDGSLEIFSLYVDEKKRRAGIGSQLVSRLTDAVGCPSVSARWILPEKEFLAAEEFFLLQGFTPAFKGEDVFRLFSKDFRKAPSLHSAFLPGYRADGNIIPVSDFTDAEMRELLDDASIPHFLRLDNFSTAELSEPACLGYRYNGHISAYFICTFSGGDSVALRAAFSRPGTPPAVFHILTAAAIKQVISRLGEDFSVFIAPVTAPAMRLTLRLSGGQYEIWSEGSCDRLLSLH